MQADLRPEQYRPAPPPREIIEQYPIGVVGCGGIMRGAHIPAYRTFGYKVVAACDMIEENARLAAERFAIPRHTTRLEDLLDDPQIKVIDLAVQASQRRPLVEQIAAAGKHILSQKPFALNYADARHMVEVCERASVTLMVNQQARWAPAHRALKLVLESGVLGHLYSVLHVNRSFQDTPGSWFVALEHFNIVDHGIHYLDLSRYFTGRTPLRVKATTTMMPGQVAVSPMIYTILCEYEPDAQVMSTLHFNNIVQVRAALGRYEWFLDGTEGSAVASQSELAVATRDDSQRKQVFALQGSWFPEAFGGSMGELLTALAEGRPPQTPGRDNLDSVKIAYAAVQSSESGRTVDLAEIG
ncbi:MAG: Gfo/Idh/MocA family protein [Chloroflexota bacterium]